MLTHTHTHTDKHTHTLQEAEKIEIERKSSITPQVSSTASEANGGGMRERGGLTSMCCVVYHASLPMSVNALVETSCLRVFPSLTFYCPTIPSLSYSPFHTTSLLAEQKEAYVSHHRVKVVG